MIQFLQLLFWSINFRSAYARLDFWYWTGKLFGKLTNAACDRAVLANKDLDDLIEVLREMND